MSATPEIPAEDLITVEINGTEFKARKGQMIIEVTDEHDISVPRFCYHKKLPVAANCRMCLVEVEKAPKPLPACATPIADGMKIFTESDYARDAQKSVMEFLLINHPLDCPICDQGGECELQDLALGYGRDVSRFAETKRVVKDKNIGPLIATEMTRCIHCTRCVRFLDVIAGSKELGGTGRGENTEIGTYVERAIESELSGNVIDVCPVGALTSKPFRFSARAWEINQHPGIAPHDCLGSNLLLHLRRGQVLRAVPAENEDINEVWLSDRDRFSYEALNVDARLRAPMVKQNGEWTVVGWDEALQAVADGLTARKGDELGVLASPSATTEEYVLLARLAAALGSNNIDHRLRRNDFASQDDDPLYPALGQPIADLENNDSVLLIGSYIRKDQPIAGHRLRKAARHGARIMAVNPIAYDFNFPLHAQCVTSPADMPAQLATLAVSVAQAASTSLPESIAQLAQTPGDEHRKMAAALVEGKQSAVLLGTGALAHPAYGSLRAIASWIAEHSSAALGYLSDGANSAGASLAGVLPHRAEAGERRREEGRNTHAMLSEARKAYLLFGVEPDFDFADPILAREGLDAAEFVVALHSFAEPGLLEHADVLLPIATFGETSGTYINANGRWQSFTGAVEPVGQARPGWKVLRVLANRMSLSGFEQESSTELRDELFAKAGKLQVHTHAPLRGVGKVQAPDAGLQRIGDVPLYAADALVRHAPALQQTPDAQASGAHLHPEEMKRMGLNDGQSVRVRQQGGEVEMTVHTDECVPTGCVRIASAVSESVALGNAFGAVEVEPA